MIYRGTVKGNVVLLEAGAQLPDGYHLSLSNPGNQRATAHWQANATSFKLASKAVETGISDLATNADHYLYGHPKVSDAG